MILPDAAFVARIARSAEELSARIRKYTSSAQFILEQLEAGMATPVVVVDYSELHEYLYVTAPSTHRIHDGAELLTDPTLLQWARTNLLETAAYHKILLPCYAQEFAAHLSESLGVSKRDMARARELKGSKQTLRRLSSQLAKALHGLGNASGVGRAEVVELLASLTGELSGVSRRLGTFKRQRMAVERLSQLRSHGKLLSVEDACSAVLPRNQKCTIDPQDVRLLCIEAFLRDRRGSAPRRNSTDAKAVVTTMELQRLVGRHRRVCLYSNTALLHELVDVKRAVLKDKAEQLWVVGSHYMLHAFLWFGVRGLAEPEKREADETYLCQWGEIQARIDDVVGDLAMYSRDRLRGRRDQQGGREGIAALEKRVDDCVADVQKQLERLHQVARERVHPAKALGALVSAFREQMGPRDDREEVLAGLEEVLGRVRALLDDDSAGRAETERLATLLRRSVDGLGREIGEMLTSIEASSSVLVGAVRELGEERGASPSQPQARTEWLSHECAELLGEVRAARFDPYRRLRVLERLATTAPRALVDYQFSLCWAYGQMLEGKLRDAVLERDRGHALAKMEALVEPWEAREIDGQLELECGNPSGALNLLEPIAERSADPWILFSAASALFITEGERWRVLARTHRMGARGAERRPALEARAISVPILYLRRAEYAARSHGDQLGVQIIWQRQMYYRLHANIVPTDAIERAVLPRLRQTKLSLEACKSEYPMDRYIGEDLAAVSDTIGYALYRIGVTRGKAESVRLLSLARQHFLAAYGINRCVECARHLAEVDVCLAEL